MSFSLVLLLTLSSWPTINGESFNKQHEPWRTLIEEGLRFPSFLQSMSLSLEEQRALDLEISEELLVVKLLLGGRNYSKGMGNTSSIDYKTLQIELKQGLQTVLGEAFPESEHFVGAWKLLEIQNFGHLPQIYFSLNGSTASYNQMAWLEVRRAIVAQKFGCLSLINGSAEVYQSLPEKYSVYEVDVQLYHQAFLPGMEARDSQSFLNTTDHMHQLLGTRFKSVFGEHYYRMVVVGYFPSLRSTIMKSYILLDPDRENIYYASIAWYDIQGFVHLGKFPMLPQNVKISECEVVLKEFFPYLSDRSYRRPFEGITRVHPLLTVTIPCILALLLFLVVMFVGFRLCHYCAHGRFENTKDRGF